MLQFHDQNPYKIDLLAENHIFIFSIYTVAKTQ